jgi:hypothetical protein
MDQLSVNAAGISNYADLYHRPSGHTADMEARSGRQDEEQ